MTKLNFDAPLSLYFREDVAQQLELSEIRTLDDLIDLVYNGGTNWWSIIKLNKQRGFGITRWLYEHQPEGIVIPEELARFGRSLYAPNVQKECEDVAVPRFTDVVNQRRLGAPRTRAGVVHFHGSELAPIERFKVPEQFDGSQGTNRNFDGTCALNAGNDLTAIESWLKARAVNENTKMAYKKEAERFLLWAIIEKRLPLSSLGLEECSDYLRWLEMLGRLDEEHWKAVWKIPQSTWIGPKNVTRNSPNWKPFNSSLSYASRRAAMTIIRQLFTFLQKTGYLIANPFDQISTKIRLLPGEGKPKEYADRSLTKQQWAEVMNFLDEMPDDIVKARLKVVLLMSKGLGMRTSEIIEARCSWFEHVMVGQEEVLMISVVGKGDKERQLPVSEEQLAIINDYFAFRDLPSVDQVVDPQTPILASRRPGKDKEHGQMLSRSGLYAILSDLLERVACSIQRRRPLDAAKLRASSTHWLRHTFAVRSLEVMPVNVVQTALGHASVGTTTRYIKPDVQQMVEQMKKAETL